MTARFAGILGVCVIVAAGCPTPTPEKPDGAVFDESGQPPAVPAKVKGKLTKPRAGHTPAAESPILKVMADENKRSLSALKADPRAPAYYIAYQITEKKTVVIEASSGSIVNDDQNTGRALDVEVRVGSPKLDNTRPLRDPRAAPLSDTTRVGTVPFGDNPKAIRRHLWLETDRRYREAADLLALVSHEQRLAANQDPAPDFSAATGEVFIEPKAKLRYDHQAWRKRLRSCSKRADAGVATRATCRAVFELNTVYFVNSEGAKLQLSWTQARMSVSVGVKADDGMPLARTEQRFAPSPGELPTRKQIDEVIQTVNNDLDELHKAPVVDPYVGPAVLEGRAAAVFFHEVFGHRIEGHRQKDDNSGQTFTSKIDQQIMPSWLSVYDDPRLTHINGTPLNGFYRFDDEGVRAQRVELVKDGVFAGFLLGRNPIKGFAQSNGHGRKEPGHFPVVARQGNLVVEASRSEKKGAIYDALIEEVKKQDKPYGMVFTDISGGFTNTSRFAPQAFKVNPVMAYRVYTDGRRELVRGVDIVGTPLTALASIRSAARPVETFNGMCGAESGWVPVSASAPSLLLEKLEIERGFKPNNSGPVLPPPRGLKGETK